jgi:COMPASS component BRE2
LERAPPLNHPSSSFNLGISQLERTIKIMSESQSPSGASPLLPPLLTPIRRPDDDHAPSIPSPLNPDAPSRASALGRPSVTKPPIVREQREKKDSLKKRESAAVARGATSDVKQSTKESTKTSLKDVSNATGVTTPMRYSLQSPELSHYNAPRNHVFASHEPNPLYAPDGQTELKRPVDQ